MYPLVWSLLKPYRGTLLIILLAMLLQMVATVAAPWPLKVILDNVVGEHKLPHWLDRFAAALLSCTGRRWRLPRRRRLGWC